MPIFEDETWKVEPQIEPHVYRGEHESLVGYLVVAETEDGTRSEIVTAHGILASDRDLEVATLFSASNDLYNAAEAVLPILLSLGSSDLSGNERKAVEALGHALAKAAAPQVAREQSDEEYGRRP